MRTQPRANLFVRPRRQTLAMPNFTRRLLCLALPAVAVLAMSGCASAPTSFARAHGEFVKREVTVAGQTRGYQVFVPKHDASAAPLPIILFLHGSGERGSDNEVQATVGLPAYVRKHMDDFPAIVVIPQAPNDSEWTEDAGPIALAALDAATREFHGDAKRTYLTGLSMGGYGTWELALQQPTRYAALVPICGGLTVDWTDKRPTMQAHSVADSQDPFAATAQALKNVPTWIFHGAKDDAVPPAQSRRMYAALQAAHAPNAHYTEFPDANHNSWDPAYATPELWTWLFQQHQ